MRQEPRMVQPAGLFQRWSRQHVERRATANTGFR